MATDMTFKPSVGHEKQLNESTMKDQSDNPLHHDQPNDVAPQ